MAKLPLTSRWPQLLAVAALAVVCGATFVAVAQPIFTDDTWIHLALGRAYLDHGPWLEADPLLADALGPPLPAAWLTGMLLHGIERLWGFTGLRVFHVAIVLCILALAFSILRRSSRSTVVACLGTGLFIALSAYRLVQLRPHLFTILACLLLFRLLFESGRPASWRSIVASVLLFALWANLHASFLLGPILLGAGVFALVGHAYLGDRAGRRQALERARPLALVLILGSLATLLNPTGGEQHLAYLTAGTETPSLGRVADEWTRFAPFALPTPRLPPSPLVWLLLWALLIATPSLALLGLRTPTSGRPRVWSRNSMDPALAGIALVSLIATLVAVRFIWLGFFPLLLAASRLGREETGRRSGTGARTWLMAGATLLLVPAYFKFGPWPMISGLLPTQLAGYRAPYQVSKYHTGAIFTLADAELEGKLFTDYYLSGFAGYWLSPRIKNFINGTLNVSPDAIEANLPIRERRGERPGESFTDLLDRHSIDFFLGTRLPRTPPSNRPWHSTTGHLEDTEGWIPIYRNLAGAVYLRDLPRNKQNLERITSYYEREGVPFDPEVGFDPKRVIAENPDWAVRQILIPRHFQRIVISSTRIDPGLRNPGMEILARHYTALGERDSAIRLDFSLLHRTKDSDSPRRRLLYNLLREGRTEEASEVAQAILDDPAASPLAEFMAETAGRILRDEGEVGAVHRMPVFSSREAAAFSIGLASPAVREPGPWATPDEASAR